MKNTQSGHSATLQNAVFLIFGLDLEVSFKNDLFKIIWPNKYGQTNTAKQIWLNKYGQTNMAKHKKIRLKIKLSLLKNILIKE